MANFKTHVTGAAGVAWLSAVSCHGLGMVGAEQVLTLTVVGALGGILPDIDSDHSMPLSIIFFCLYLLTGHAILINTEGDFSFLTRLGLCLLGLLLLRFMVLPMFKDWTRHRGILHSVLAAVFFALLSTAVAKQLYAVEAGFAWLIGCFVLQGYLVHLLLDEFYSIDFNGKRLKRSLGSAFKLWNWQDKEGRINTLVIFILSLIALDYTPEVNALLAHFDTRPLLFSKWLEQVHLALGQYL